MKKLLIILCFLTLLPSLVNAFEIDKINSKAIYLYNLTEDEVMYDLNSDQQLPVASLTKLMTILVTIEKVDNLDQEILVTSNMLAYIDWDLVVAGFKSGEKVTYRDLIYGALMKSGADAAHILAVAIDGSEEKFSLRMNDTAKRIGMKNTHFTNSIGKDTTPLNYSSAKDIALLLKYAINNKTFLSIFESNTYTATNGLIFNAAGNYLGVDKLIGIKSGFTTPSGYCLSTLSEVNDSKYILVTLGSPKDLLTDGMKADNISIYSYLKENYSYHTILKKNDVIKNIATYFHVNVDLRSTNDVKVFLDNSITNDKLTYKYEGIEILNRDVKKGDYLGKYTISYNDKVLYETDVYAPDNVITLLIKKIFKACVIELSLFLILIIFIIILRKKKI